MKQEGDMFPIRPGLSRGGLSRVQCPVLRGRAHTIHRGAGNNIPALLFY